MSDKHIFSKSYENRKEAVLDALHREDAIEESKNTHFTVHTVVKIAAFAAVLSVLSVGVYAAVRLIDFNVEQNGDEIHIHASLNDSGESTADKEEKPLRSWNSEEGEISIRLIIPDLPSDMEEDKTANGKYHSEDSSRSMTINGIDLRRSDLDQIIGGTTAIKQLDAGGKPMYVIAGGEVAYYRLAYILFEEDELVLKLWVSYGITDDELLAMASTLTLEETDNALLAIPIMNEVSDGSDDEQKVYYSETDPVYESDLLEIGESTRDATDWYTATVNSVEVYDNINVLNPNYILRKNFVEQFTDTSGNLIPYNRTEIVYSFEDGKYVSRHFGESITSQKKLYVITLTMADVTMDGMDEEDRDSMLKACVYGFDLVGYTVTDGKIDITWSSEVVVDKKPEAHADCSEAVYREYLGNNQWKVAYLVDETIADGDLLFGNYTGKIYVKIR